MIPSTREFFDNTAHLDFVGEIGTNVNADEFAQALHRIRRVDEATVLIDCVGGNIAEAAQIVALIRGAPFQINSIVTGRCFSSAVDILMATCWRQGLVGCSAMLHECNSEYSSLVEEDKNGLIAAYSPRTQPGGFRGSSAEMIRAWVEASTYFSDQEMLHYGFISKLLRPSERLPLRTAVDLRGMNRPTPSPPYVVYGSYAGTPVWNSAYELDRPTVPTATRRTITIPPMPKALRGKVIASFDDAADVHLRLTDSICRGPNDPRAVLAATNAAMLLEGRNRISEMQYSAMSRAMADAGARRAAGG